jgi:hypothetical protein
MAWVTPRTYTAAAVLTAAQLNETRDNLKALLPLDALAWTSYTPTLTQLGAVTKTVTYAKYTRLANCVIVRCVLACTGSGTANNLITVSLPVTASQASDIPCGVGYVKATNWFPGEAITSTTTTIAFIDTSQAVAVGLGQTGSSAGGALASGNTVGFQAAYEV